MRMASVVVTCKETDLKRTVLTPDAGEYIVPVLAPGLYEVTADAAWEPCKQHTSPMRRKVGAQCPNIKQLCGRILECQLLSDDFFPLAQRSFRQGGESGMVNCTPERIGVGAGVPGAGISGTIQSIMSP